VRVDPCDISEPVRIDDAKTPIVELDDLSLSQIAKHAIDVYVGEACGIPDVLLCQREMHFFDALARPSHAIANEQLKQQSRDPFARRSAADSGQVVICEIALLPDSPEDSFVAYERTAARQVFNAIEDLRKKRDAAAEQIFGLVYGAAERRAALAGMSR
jgi:hypothetical protein